MAAKSRNIRQIRVSYEGPAEVHGDGAVLIGGGSPCIWVHPNSPFTIEVLPDPIVFADGDVLLHGSDRTPRHRLGGEWYYSDGIKTVYDDAFYAEMVERGAMTRVFPATDAKDQA